MKPKNLSTNTKIKGFRFLTMEKYCSLKNGYFLVNNKDSFLSIKLNNQVLTY